MVTKPTPTVCRQRRGVHSLQHEVFGSVDELLLGARGGALEQEYHVLATVGDGLYHRIGELLPPMSLV